MGRHKEMLLLAFLDALLVNLSLFLAFLLRFDGMVPARYWLLYLKWLPLVTFLPLIIFMSYGLYHRVWRFASLCEFYALLKAISASNLLFFFLTYYLARPSFPKSVLILNWLLMLVLNGGIRFSARIFSNIRCTRGGKGSQDQSVLIVGAGGAGALVARTLLDNDTTRKPIGFVDDSPEKLHRQLYGLPILGARGDIPRLVRERQIQEIILALPSAPREEVRRLVGICRETPAKIKILPSVFKVIDGQLAPDQIRAVQLEDLLGREPVELNLREIAGYLANQAVLVTGAGGSIGSELCREIAGFGPRLLILLGHGENSIYDLEVELGQSFPALQLAREIADVRDRERIEAIFEEYRPQVVFHAAAHKHVPLMETAPYEAFTNNVMGTINVARAAGKVVAGTFILISTDKAVNPTSVMGATKRAAELALLNLANRYPTRYAAVRFGNVLGSRGSVLPLFKKQIAAGGPVTVTHPEMVRYFMLIREAVQLVIQAGAMARGKEIFVLDMGEPVKIVDLARDLIKLSGFQPDREIEIRFTGIRPGEKLAEELLTREEGATATRHKRIYVAISPGLANDQMDLLIDRGIEPELAWNPREVIKLLKQLVPDYREYWAEKRRPKDGTGGS